MSTLDTSIQDTDQSVDSALPEAVTPFTVSPRLESWKALKAAYLDNYTSGKPLIEGYREHKAAGNQDSNLAQLSEDKKVEDNIAATEVLDEIAVSDPEIFVEALEVEQDLRNERDELAQNPTKQFVDAIAEPDVAEETKDVTANYIALYEILEEHTKDIDGWDLAGDFAKTLIPFRDTINETSLLGSTLNNEDRVRDIIFGFKSMDFKQQQDMFPYIVEEFIDELGPIRGMDVLTKFINPDTEDELGDFSNWWKVIDAVDIASLGGAALLKAIQFKKAFNLPKVLDKVENEEAAGDVVAMSLADEEVADAANMTQDTAFNDAVAFDTSTIDPAYTAGISATSLESRKKFFDQADATVEDIMTGNGYLKQGILNTVERNAREKIALDSLSEAKHENIRLVERTENTTKFRYDARDEDGNLYPDEYTLDLTLNDVGQHNQSEIGVISELIGSPTVFAKGTFRQDADIAQIMDEQTAKVFRVLTDLQKEAVKPLGNLNTPKGRAKLAKLNHVLKEGDEWLDKTSGQRGKVFSVEELAGEYELDSDMVETYYRTNRLYNNLWRLRNNTKREEMIAFNYKQVALNADEYSFGKPHDTAGDAWNSVRSANIGRIYDNVTKEAKDVTRDLLDEEYALGKILVKMPEAYNAPGAGKFSHVLVNPEEVTELPSVVLNRKVGYVPRISDNGDWFVKEYADDTVDGKATTSLVKTHRYFDNKKDAETFRESLIVKAMDDEGLTRKQAEERYRALEDREQEIVATATGNFSHGTGGVYTAARAEDEILFGLEGTRGNRIAPYEALIRNISNVSRLVPINQWRLGMEQRWLNTARALTGEEITNFGALPETVESTRVGAFLNKMAKQIRDWQGFPTREERIYQGVVQRMYEWAVGKDLARTSKALAWIKDKDPIASARAAAFHGLLGWYNPAQLWVQAQGMSVAVSLAAGKNLTKILQQVAGLTYIGDFNRATEGQIKFAAKAAGMDVAEFRKLNELWEKTGLHDSILQTADHAAGMRGHGIAMDAISSAADKGLFFYRGGELITRRTAFVKALEDFKAGEIKGYPKGSPIDDEALKQVLVRTNNLMLNLTKANRASWQKGLMSVPTQFFQVSAKAGETLAGINGNFTKAERGRIAAGQIALYGTAGVPLASLGVSYLKEVAGFTQEDLDNNPVMVKAVNDGFWGLTTMGIFGLVDADVDIELSARGSLVRGVSDFVENWMFSESNVAVKMMGAFGSTGQRFWDSFTENMRIVTLGGYDPSLLDVGKLVTMPFLESISTWRNVEKAVFMQTIDSILAKNGDKNVERDFKIRESIAAAIGFRLTDEVQIYDLKEQSDAVVKANRKIADLLLDRMASASNRESLGILTEAYKKETEEFYAALYGSVEPDRQLDIMKSVQQRIKGESRQAREIQKYLEKVYGMHTTDLLTMKKLVVGDKLLNVQEPEEE